MTLDPEWLLREIDTACRTGRYKLGWRLLASPWSTTQEAEVAFVGLNPGGKDATLGHGTLCMDAGSAYLTESWAGWEAGKSPLQKQVLSVFDRLGVQPDTVLAGNLIPFRSPNAASLAGTPAAIEFGERLWQRLLKSARPGLVVTMGAIPALSMRKIGRVETMTRHLVGWGNVTASRGEGSDFRLICLPHLSRYRIMDRPQSRDALDAVFCGEQPPQRRFESI